MSGKSIRLSAFSKRRKNSILTVAYCVTIFLGCFVIIPFFIFHATHTSLSKDETKEILIESSFEQPNSAVHSIENIYTAHQSNGKQKEASFHPMCLNNLPYPDDRKHMVKPPSGPVTLVCCNTTKGILNVEVHRSWAPNGAERFLHMVKNGFFSTKIGLFRNLKNFLVQFGLAGDPEVHRKYKSMGNLPDDPSWLPLGPTGREINGVYRFQKGYLAYAGAGKNSRGTQLIMAYQDSKYLAGGCPWEVPFGQLVGAESFRTLSKFYTGYGEKPSQGKIMNRGVSYLEEEFPLLDYITRCDIVRENVPWKYVNISGIN